jgi:hypothetical protein
MHIDFHGSDRRRDRARAQRCGPGLLRVLEKGRARRSLSLPGSDGTIPVPAASDSASNSGRDVLGIPNNVHRAII